MASKQCDTEKVPKRVNMLFDRAMAGKRMSTQAMRGWLEVTYGSCSWSPYGLTIMETVADARPEDTYQIEEMMRGRHRTLDNIYWEEFRDLANAAWLAVKQLRASGELPTVHYSEGT